MNGSPSFQFYPKDFYSDEKVQLMDFVEEAAYLRLLSHQWLNGSVPGDLADIARILRVALSEVERMWPRLAPCFQDIGEGRLANARMERDRSAREAFVEKQRANGSLGGRPRMNGSVAEPQTSPETLPSSKADDPIKAIVDSCDHRIKEPLLRWMAYRRERKIAAYKESGLRALIAAMSKMQDCADAVEFSISMNYQGLFERGRGPALNGKAPELTMREKHEADMAELSRRHGFDD